MRNVKCALIIASLLLLSGCNGTKWAFLKSDRDDPRAYNDKPTAVELVGYMNQNAQQLQGLDCPNVEIDSRIGGNMFGSRGRLMCQKPRNFRMVAENFGKTEADFGSNNQEFWYWIARNNPPYLVHCTYDDIARGVRVPFPFQPEWAMEAMGMVEHDPNGQYQLVQRGKNSDRLELVQETVNSRREKIQKVVVFKRVEGKMQIVAHSLRDERGKEICTAYVTDSQSVNGVIVPRKIELVYPAEKMQLKLTLYRDLRDVKINPVIEQDQAAALFTRPTMPGVQSYDLATRGLDGPINRTGGMMP